ncbi:MAG: hypothetical protein ACFB0C_15635 [Leptolyngbyaceae cyanobacterium]
MQIIDAATARNMLDQIDFGTSGKLQVKDGSTLIAEINMANPATGAASGAAGPGTRTKAFLGEPLTSAAAANASADNATPLTVDALNGSTVITTFTCTINGGGGEFQITAPAHSGNATKPNITAGQTVTLQEGAAMTL